MTEPDRSGSLTVGARVFWRQLRFAPGAAITIFVATMLTAFFVTAVPRMLEQVSDDDLRDTLVEAEPEQRNFRAESTTRLGAGPPGDSFVHVGNRVDRLLEGGFPESIRSIIGDSQYVVDTPEFGLVSFPDGLEGPFPTTFRFRYQQGIEDHLTVVDGALPEERTPIPMLVGQDCPDDRLATQGFEESPDVACSVVDIPVFETAVTAETAAAMMLEVGDLVAEAGITDETHAVQGDTFVLAISGIIELSDLSEEYWFADADLHRPRIEENADFRLIFATGLMRPDDYAELHTVSHTFDYTWRYFVDPNLVEATQAEELRGEVARVLPINEEEIYTSLDTLITEYLNGRALTVGLMSTVVVGIVVLAVGLILVLAALIADRHAGATILIRDRGASRGQLTLTAAYTGLALVVPATVVGYLVTMALLPDTGALTPGRGSAALAFGGAGAVVVAGWPYVFGRLGALQRRDIPAAESSSGRRLVAEIFVFVAAVVSVVLLRRRGLADQSGTVPEGVDGLLAVAPAVIGLAVGLAVLRLMGPLMRGLSWLGARGKDAIVFVGFRRLITQPPASRAPIVVVLVAVTLAVFSSVVRIAISDGQERHSWQVVGGDYRVEASLLADPLPTAVEAGELAAGEPWAAGAVFEDVRLIGFARAPRVRVLAIDAAAYEEVLAGSGLEVPALDSLADVGDGPVPLLVSSRWNATGAPGPGTEFALDMGSTDPKVVVAGVVDSFPTVPTTEIFVVIGLDNLRSALGELPVSPTVLFFSGPESHAERLTESFGIPGQSARVTSRYEVRADLAGAPFPLWVDRGLAITLYLALVFAVVASLSLLTVTANGRRRDLGYLRTLGLTQRQATVITGLEQIPPLVVATLFGAVTGGAVARLLAPALDFGAFTGGLLPVETRIEPGAILVTSASMLLVLVASAVTFVAANRDEEFLRQLRVGDE